LRLPKFKYFSADHVVRNNIVKNFSRWAKTYRPAFNVDGVGITIENNEMFNGPHTALLWTGNYHTFQRNIIHDVRIIGRPDSSARIYVFFFEIS
jgi:hypothetical protein